MTKLILRLNNKKYNDIVRRSNKIKRFISDIQQLSNNIGITLRLTLKTGGKILCDKIIYPAKKDIHEDNQIDLQII